MLRSPKKMTSPKTRPSAQMMSPYASRLPPAGAVEADRVQIREDQIGLTRGEGGRRQAQ